MIRLITESVKETTNSKCNYSNEQRISPHWRRFSL